MILSILAVEGFSKSWNGITPGISTRFEVEKILGKDSPKSELAYYRFKKFNVSIEYDKKANDSPDKDIARRITIFPGKRDQPMASYIKKTPNFHKDFIKTEIPNEISHVNGLAIYSNDVEGFEIRVQRGQKTGSEIITSFSYYPPYHRQSQE
jgi:hypothetical protein